MKGCGRTGPACGDTNIVESLERRCLLSSTVPDGSVLLSTASAGQVSGVYANVGRFLNMSLPSHPLLINGDLSGNPTDDTIIVRPCRNAAYIKVLINGVQQPLVPAASVTGIVVYGLGGNDYIDVTAMSIPATLSGGAGDDTILGGSGNDSISGGDGNDCLGGGDGNDTITGNTGFDYIDGGRGNDFISGGANSDTLYGGAGADTLRGGAGDNSLSGGSGADSLVGGAGNDTLAGSGGADTLDGGGGTDTVSYAGFTIGGISLTIGDSSGSGTGNDLDVIISRFDAIIGTSFGDVIDASSRTYPFTVWGRAGNDTITGGSGADSLSGEAGDDVIYGGAGDDTLVGGSGSDLLCGDDGNDLLVDGEGKDTVCGDAGDDAFRAWDDGETGTFDGGDGNDEAIFFWPWDKPVPATTGIERVIIGSTQG